MSGPSYTVAIRSPGGKRALFRVDNVDDHQAAYDAVKEAVPATVILTSVKPRPIIKEVA